MQNAQCKTPSGQSTKNDLVNTPEHLHPGYCGQPRQYDPREFSLTGSEEWRNPRMFRNMTYETDAEAMNAMRQAQPRRPAYRQLATSIVNNLTEECLANVSAPPLQISIPSQMSASGGEYLANVTPPQLCASADATKNSVLTTVRTVTTHRDKSGNVTSCIEETSRVSNSPQDQVALLESTPHACSEQPPTPGRQLHLSNMPDQSENIADISMPLFYDNTMPALNTRRLQGSLPSERLTDISAPALADSMERRMRNQSVCFENIGAPSYPSSSVGRSSVRQEICEISAPTFAGSNLEDISMPSGISGANGDSSRQSTQQYTNECLNNVTMPSILGSSGASRRQFTQMCQDRLDDITMPSLDMSGPTGRQAGFMTSECLNDVSAPSFGSSTTRSRIYRSHPRSVLAPSNLSSTALEDISMPFFDGPSSTASRSVQHRSMQSQPIVDILAPSYVSYGQSPSADECLENISMPLYGSMEASTNSYLADVSMPSYAGVSERSLSRQHRSIPSQTIGNTSVPTYGHSGRGKVTNECLEEAAMASFPRTPTRQQYSTSTQSMTPSFESYQEYLDQVTMPSFENSTRGPMTNEFLADVSRPSFAGVSGSSRGKTSSRQQRQHISNISAPIYESSRVGQMNNECLDEVTQPSFRNTGREVSYKQFLEEISMPSFGGVSGASRVRSPTRQQQQQSMASQNICDISAPSINSSGRQQQAMPSLNIGDISAPSFGSSGPGTLNNECLENVTMPSHGNSRKDISYSQFLEEISMPSFGGVSGASRARTPTRQQQQQQQSMASQNICDISAPSMNSSGRQQQAMPSLNIGDISAPSFGSSGPGTLNNECLENVTMPSYGNSRKDISYSQFLDEISMPSFGGVSGASRARTLTRQHNSQKIDDISAPSSDKGRRRALSIECSEDTSMPSGAGVSSSSRRQPTLPSECLDNVSAPSFGQSMMRTRSPHCQQRKTQNDSGKTFQGTTTTTTTSEFIDGVSMPSFGGVSGASTAQTPVRQQHTLLTKTKGSASSSNRCAPMDSTSECLDNISMPLYPSSLALRGQTPLRKQQAMNSQNICDISSFESSRRQQQAMASQNICDASCQTLEGNGMGGITDEFLNDISMPSCYSRPYTSECLNDISAPSFGRSISCGRSPRYQQIPSNACRSSTGDVNDEYIMDVSMPSFGGISSACRPHSSGQHRQMLQQVQQQQQQQQQRSLQPQNICDISAKSYANSGRGMATDNERLQDISMPSFEEVPSSSRRQQSMTSECLNDVTAPTFTWNRSPQCMHRSPPNRANRTDELQDVSMPSFGDVSGARKSSRQQRWMPGNSVTNECLENVSIRSLGALGASQARSPTMPSQNIFDISAPSYNCSGFPSVSAKRIGRSQSQGPSPRAQRFNSSSGRRHSECIQNVAMPSFNGFSTINNSMPMVSDYLSNVSPPSFGRSAFTQELWNISPPAFTSSCSEPLQLRRPRSEPSYLNDALADESSPIFELSSRGFKSLYQMPKNSTNALSDSQLMARQVRSFPCLAGQQYIDDISAPSMDSRGPELCSGRSRDVSYPCEMLGNVTAPSYMSGSNRSKSRQTSRLTRCCMSCENTENVTEPSGLANSAMYGQKLSDRIKEEIQRLADVSEPSGMESTFLCSNAASDDFFKNEMLRNVSAPSYANTTTRSNTKQTTCLTSYSMSCENIADVTEPSGLASSTMYSQTGSDQLKDEIQRLADESEPSGMQSSYVPVDSNIMDVSEPCEMFCSDVCAEIRDTKNSELKVRQIEINEPKTELKITNNEVNGQSIENNVTSETPSPKLTPKVSFQDLTHPKLQSEATGKSPSRGQSNYRRKTEYNSQGNNVSYNGFDSLPNYANFDEIVNSRPKNTRPLTPQSTRSMPTESPTSQKAETKTPQSRTINSSQDNAPLNGRSSVKQKNRNTTR
ncbi:uncharacterized protein LOC111598825 [Drosophila hydei]|uniref:Uncharacterized protein LOC111598825 n=1 Tax=Drosophila hydei TaxID=7224 RepID=A0A6J2SNQ1_DROHY|nr:uncharacterized protein LOC111598825 [Drosophila hydei]